MEVLLATGLVVLLLALGIASFRGLYESERVGEGARQVESILRLARADAAARGRRVRLVFQPETLQPIITWEPRPLEEPGIFVPHTAASWASQLPVDLVRIRRCQRTGASAVQTLTYHDAEELQSPEGKILQSVTFYPDGSCDSAIIEVAALDDSDSRIGRIVLDGMNGTLLLRILTPIEQEEQDALDAEAGNL